MKQAPLQLADYWAVSTHVDANPAFKNEEPVSLSFDSIKVRHGIKQLESEQPKNDGTRWLVDLTVEQGIGDGGNVPYSFTLKMQGIVLAHPDLPEDRLTRVVSVNGTTMLFGAAREVIRAATGRGPFPAVIIPSTNFLDEDTPKPAKKAAKKKAARKSVKP